MARRYWLMKSEPDVFSYDDLVARPGSIEAWDGVRNYQARNFMRDEMQIGDRILFYHSRTDPPGVVGIAEVASKAHPDITQFDKRSNYYDPKSTPQEPRWVCVDVRAVEKLPRLVSLSELKEEPSLAEMKVVQKGQRLSIQPVTADEFNKVVAMARRKPRS